MPPRFVYWTIIAGGLPTAFRATEREDLLPTFHRIREKHPDAQMKWFARGKLWETKEEADRERDERRARAAERERAPRPRTGPGRGRDWRPGGEHRDPRQPYKDAKKARNQDRRQERFTRKHGDAPPSGKPGADRPKPAGPKSDKPWSAKPRFDKPRFDKPRFDKPRDDKPGFDKPRFDKPRDDKPRFDRPRSDRPPSDRPAGRFDRPVGKGGRPAGGADRPASPSSSRPGGFKNTRREGWKKEPPGSGSRPPRDRRPAGGDRPHRDKDRRRK